MRGKPEVVTFFDEPTNNATHIAIDPATRACAIIDSLLDYDAASGRTGTASAEKVIDHVRSHDLKVAWIIDTHVHADHLSAAHFLKDALGGQTGIGEKITEIQALFGKLFNVEADFRADGRQFDHLFTDGERYALGEIEAVAMHTPGHTPACMTHVIGDAAFVGDTLFMPDYGTARCDFPGGDAHVLYQSIQKIFALPDETRIFLNHDYKAKGRDDYVWETTVAEEKADNIHVGGDATEAAFVKMRTERDKTLAMPKLIIPSVQINMRAGELPPPEDNDIRYIKVPINAL